MREGQAKTQLAVLFYHLDPYHVARLQAAVREGRGEVVELATRSGEYAWAEVACDGG